VGGVLRRTGCGAWEYEAQGYTLRDGTNYLPDFYLPTVNERGPHGYPGVHVEVKGDESALDKPMLRSAGAQLPGGLIVLGPIPVVSDHEDRDWAWPYLNDSGNMTQDLVIFAMTTRKKRLCYDFSALVLNESHWLVPQLSDEDIYPARDAYRAARSARFEHGHSGRS